MSNHQAGIFLLFVLASSARCATAEGMRQTWRYAFESMAANILILAIIYGGKW